MFSRLSSEQGVDTLSLQRPDLSILGTVGPDGLCPDHLTLLVRLKSSQVLPFSLGSRDRPSPAWPGLPLPSRASAVNTGSSAGTPRTSSRICSTVGAPGGWAAPRASWPWSPSLQAGEKSVDRAVPQRPAPGPAPGRAAALRSSQGRTARGHPGLQCPAPLKTSFQQKLHLAGTQRHSCRRGHFRFRSTRDALAWRTGLSGSACPMPLCKGATPERVSVHWSRMAGAS